MITLTGGFWQIQISLRKWLYVPSAKDMMNENMRQLWKDFTGFLWKEKKWWLIPLLIIILMLFGLLLLSGGGALSPMMYSPE